jgi:hypothetical protein
MRPSARPLLPLVLVAAGCATVAGLADPPLAQLARWRDTPRDSVAAEPVVAPCPAANPACPRLHALRAEACLGEALAARAPQAACPPSRTAPLLDCAADGYAAALSANAPNAPVLRSGMAQALLCRAELDDPTRAATRAATAAEAAAGAPPELAALHGARAALLLARLGPAPRRCAEARRALDLSAAAPVEHSARLSADALLHLRTCEAPPR